MRTVISMLVLSLVSGCAELAEDFWSHRPNPGGDNEEPAEDVRCLHDAMWAVDGDRLTFSGGGAQTVPTGSDNASQGGSGISESEPLARTRLTMRANSGVAELSWDGVVVDSFELDETFFYSGERKVLSYLEADGTGVEYHVFTSSTCQLNLPPTATRAELEALER